MQKIKSIMAWFTNMMLGVVLFILASAVTINLLFNAAYFKNMLKTSGVYANFVPSLLGLANYQSSLDSKYIDKQKTLNSLKPVIESAITPQIVQGYSEQAIDQTANWLAASDQPLTITLDVAPVKSNLNRQISDFIQNRLHSLPFCKNSSSVDILSTKCKPLVGVSSHLISRIVDEYTSSLPFLKENTLVFGEQAKQEILNSTPLVATVLKTLNVLGRLWYIVLLIALLGVLLIYLLHAEKSKVWQIIAKSFLSTGIMLIVFGLISVLFIKGGVKPLETNATIEQFSFTNLIVIPLVKQIVNDIGRWWLCFGLAYSLIGAVCYFIGRRLKLRRVASSSLLL